MHLWQLEKWTKYYDSCDCRKGLRVHYEPPVNQEVKQAIHNFCLWLRREFYFPIRVNVYVKASDTIKAMDGERVSATFFGPYNHLFEPYIRISTGDYLKRREKIGRDNALASILFSLAHELSHYYQWINDINLTPIGLERQATRYAEGILAEYSDYTDHP